MAFIDRTLACRDCGNEFVFTSGEQDFYRAKGLQNEPQRCPTCRANRRREKLGLPAREMHQVTCAICKGTSFVPFVPRLDRPVYCSNCFEKVKSTPAGTEEATEATEAAGATEAAEVTVVTAEAAEAVVS